MVPTTIKDVAALVRSKNAGAFWLTFDIMMKDDATYELVKRSNAITQELIARLYRVPVETIVVVEHDSARAIKVSFPRPRTSGARTIPTSSAASSMRRCSISSSPNSRGRCVDDATSRPATGASCRCSAP